MADVLEAGGWGSLYPPPHREEKQCTGWEQEGRTVRWPQGWAFGLWGTSKREGS